MKLSREDVLHISTLARVGMTEDDIEKFRAQLSNILEQFEVLKQVDTTNVAPTAHSTEVNTVIREDKPTDSLTKEDVLANAPRREEDFFRVKAVLEG